MLNVIFDRGVFLPELDLWLDSRRARETSFISHAHADHTGRHQQPVVTPNTQRLMNAPVNGHKSLLAKSSPITLQYHEPLETQRYRLTLYPAGHCLGSSQALIQSKITGERILYTGDFKARSSPINEPLEPVRCDTLIMEATYGQPQYTFPPQEKVLDRAFGILREWLSRGEKAIVQGWRLGKSQELLHHFLTERFDVAVEESAYRVTEAYLQSGVKFPGEFRCFDKHWVEGQVLICPPGRYATSCLDGLRGKKFMELTGWATNEERPWGRQADASLPYSDHADFNELVEYVRQVKPKRVYTVFGFPDLAAHLRRIGYSAVHLDDHRQTDTQGVQMRLL